MQRTSIITGGKDGVIQEFSWILNYFASPNVRVLHFSNRESSPHDFDIMTLEHVCSSQRDDMVVILTPNFWTPMTKAISEYMQAYLIF